MNINIDIDNSVINESFLPLFTAKERYIILYGGAGSGKSVSVAQRLVYDSLTMKDSKWLMVRKVKRNIKESVYSEVNNIVNNWDLSGVVSSNKTEHSFDFKTGSKIISTGLDDVNKLKSIEGVTGIWFEECTEGTFEDTLQLDLRARHDFSGVNQLIFTFNPISELHWIKGHYFDQEQSNTFIHHSTYNDNKFLNENSRKVLEDLINKDPNFYKIYCLGEWGILEGVIYKNWDIVEKFPDCKDVGYGMDFGFTNHSSTLVKIGTNDHENYYLDEIFYETGLLNQQIIDILRDRGITRYSDIVADCAEPKSIEQIKRAGFNIYPCKKGKDSVKYGIDIVKTCKLHVVRGSSNLVKELKTYSWKKDKDGEYLHDEPIKFNDHMMDAIRYYIAFKKPSLLVTMKKGLR